MSDVLRIGQVGLGWFGGLHLQTWADIAGVEVTGVYDADPSRVGAFGAHQAQEDFHVRVGGEPAPRLAAGTEVFSSLDELLASGIQVLDVVVPEGSHADCVRRGLEAGVDVIVEKPLALDPAEARDLVRLAEQVGRNVYVGHILRFDPRNATLGALLRNRTLRHLSLSRRFQPAALDVYGRVHPVHTAMIHDIDLAIWYTGRRPDRVTAFATSHLGREFPDVVDLVLHWDDGVRAVIGNSWHLAPNCPYGFEFECKVQTDGGTYTVRNEPDLLAWDENGVKAPDLFFWPHYEGARHGALRDELQHFADRARQGRPSERVPLEHAVWVAETCRAALDSIAGAGTVAVAGC
ncbi:putative dehydrogenase [Kitasatospora gansuensis]|uniref:Putative dehydrogenase n=1 Tax=Kitasatospora gansuensis TaxID=258050 RepID=A0A7W7SBL5_9ACTN|nr:Gfo/Idh/MocA family oxidoreductase [Kitasatospora gansuensis]MBB4947494.1 putative dehydrogenase [Kitasatospora gansuensis]